MTRAHQDRPAAEDDPFDAALNVESSFHSAGYNQGLVDGAQAGLAEGRSFGMQKGFEKFFESGRLASRSVVWANRLPSAAGASAGAEGTTTPGPNAHAPPSTARSLPPVPNNARLEKNIATLYALVDPKMLSAENTDAAVQDFDDRMKRAEGKVRIIERVIDGGSSKQDSQDR